MELLRAISEGYKAFIIEHGKEPNFLLITELQHKELMLDKGLVSDQYLPFIDDVTIIITGQVKSWCYVIK